MRIHPDALSAVTQRPLHKTAKQSILLVSPITMFGTCMVAACYPSLSPILSATLSELHSDI
jgi:hypothetical protein